MRNRQKRLFVRVHPAPDGRNRQTILVVERVLKTAGINGCAGLRHGRYREAPCPTTPHFSPFPSQESSKNPSRIVKSCSQIAYLRSSRIRDAFSPLNPP